MRKSAYQDNFAIFDKKLSPNNIPTRLFAGFILFEYLCLEEIINLIFYRYLKSSISYAEVDARTTCEDPRQGGGNT